MLVARTRAAWLRIPVEPVSKMNSVDFPLFRPSEVFSWGEKKWNAAGEQADRSRKWSFGSRWRDMTM